LARIASNFERRPKHQEDINHDVNISVAIAAATLGMVSNDMLFFSIRNSIRAQSNKIGKCLSTLQSSKCQDQLDRSQLQRLNNKSGPCDGKGSRTLESKER